MQLGATSVDILSDGALLLDGGASFGQVPRAQWEVLVKPDRKNRIRMGLNCLLIQAQGTNILVDTGAGSKRLGKYRDQYGLNGNKLTKGLKAHTLTPRDIDVVLLTHLHFDHAGGCTKLDRSGNAVPVFTKARYMVQAGAWEEANEQNERSRGAYDEDDFVPLHDAGMLDLIDGDQEIAPGVRVKVTGGHSAGHQVVLLEAGSERIAYLGDLIPTPLHLPLRNIAAFDRTPDETLEEKRELLEMAASSGWLLVFGHALTQRAGYVEQRNGRAHLQPVDI